MERMFPDSIHQVFKASASQEPVVKMALPSIIGFLCPDYKTYNNPSGSGFVSDNQGTVITAYHVYEDRTKEWNGSENIALLTLDGVLPHSGLEFLFGDRKEDFAILRTPKLKGQGIRISKTPYLTYEAPYYMIGYPYVYRHFPYNFECAVSIGQRKKGKPILGLNREFLWCSIFAGFSGAPILDTKGFVRAIAIACLISFTKTDYADILPLSVLSGWYKT